MEEHVIFAGRPSCLVFATKDHKGLPSQEFRTLFIQELLRRGILGQSLAISAAHTDADINQTIDAVSEALEVYARQSRRAALKAYWLADRSHLPFENLPSRGGSGRALSLRGEAQREGRVVLWRPRHAHAVRE
jgi:hypothetical protein